MLNRLFPRQADNTFHGHRAALGQLTITVFALTALIRYRAMVPFVYLMLSLIPSRQRTR